MSDSNNNIILLYNNVKKPIKIPETFSDLEITFLKEFNIEKNDKTFIYSYSDDDDENVFIDKEFNFNQAIESIKKKSEPIIEVQEDRGSKLEMPNENEYKNSIEENKGSQGNDDIDLDPSISLSIKKDSSEKIEEENKSLDPLTSGTVFIKPKKNEEDKQNKDLDSLTSGTVFTKPKKEQDVIIEDNDKNEPDFLNNINNNFQNINLYSNDTKIKKLEGKINKLNIQLLEEQKKNAILNEENSKLKKQIEELNIKINNLHIQINPKIYSNSIKMNELYQKIADLQEKLNRFPFILKKNEKLISIIFSSVGQNIHYSIVCKNTDDLNKLERELYREYPQFSETDNYFIYKGKVINKFHTFESNHIKNGDVILVNQRDI